jgi:transposase InsO family protein
VCDLKYIRTRNGWLYLAAVLDLHLRQIVGWAMAPEMPAMLVCAALQMGIAQRNPAQGLLVHSDRLNALNTRVTRIRRLKNHGFVGTMSRKGNSWDNSVMERFFLDLKMERVWQPNTPITTKPSMTWLATCSTFTTPRGCTPNWATCHPMLSSINRHLNPPIDVSEIT